MNAPTDRPTVFYSWQSDSSSAGNRSLIAGALEIALDRLDEASVELVPRIDQDTAGLPGSPDIATAILSKIDSCAALVADVSLVVGDAETRKSPNPNVLFEVGYAWRAIGASRIVLVMNEHFGSVSDLPFDLRAKRVLTYRSDPNLSDRATARKELASKLAKALDTILTSPEFRPPSTSDEAKAIDAIRERRRGRRDLVRSVASKKIDDALSVGDELRDLVANDHHPETARRVFDVLSELASPLSALLEFATKVVDEDDDDGFDGLLMSLDTALEATWVDCTKHQGPIPLRFIDFARMAAKWMLLAVIALPLRSERYRLLQVALDHRFRPRILERNAERDGGHPLTVFQQAVPSARFWAPSAFENYIEPIGAGLKRISTATSSLDSSVPDFESLMAADALIAFCSRNSMHGCDIPWRPCTSIYARGHRFPWFRELARRKNAKQVLGYLGIDSIEAARREWAGFVNWEIVDGHLKPYEAMVATSIGSVD